MLPRFVADIGSCHMGKYELAEQAIDLAHASNIDVLKFQLFKGYKFRKVGNIETPLEWWPRLWDYARGKNLPITASVFNEKALDMLIEYRPTFIKLSYSMQDEVKWIEKIRKAGIDCVVSTDFLRRKPYHQSCIRLFCLPLYPVPFIVDFKNIFSRDYFHGLSDHTLGISQTLNATIYGLQMIEKHLRLVDSDCPDSRFALLPFEFNKLIRSVKESDESSIDRR